MIAKTPGGKMSVTVQHPETPEEIIKAYKHALLISEETSTKALVRISELTKIIELMANEIWALEMPQNGINYKQTRADIIQYFTKKAREAK
jgi:predicted metal-binding protein